jgi:para-aminobenzoate synthetase component 1
MDEHRGPDPMQGHAVLAGREARRPLEVRHDLGALEEPGFWVVVGTFEGAWTCVRFGVVSRCPTDTATAEAPGATPDWKPLPGAAWRSSLSRDAYRAAVAAIRDRIAAGEVYQVNLCRVLDAPLAPSADLDALAARLAAGNPAPYAARVHVPSAQLDVVCASPELYLRRTGRDVASAPIKGTGARAGDLTSKDVAENVMIVDLVRNDLGQVAEPGSVVVDDVLEVQQHPGLAHLVSTVRARLRSGTGWADLLDATFPPGSVSGAPKSSALQTIAELEPAPRGPYCGAIGWVDGASGDGDLAVGIRTFWAEDGRLRFGTGAGITWDSDPDREWAETELKASRLLGLAGA